MDNTTNLFAALAATLIIAEISYRVVKRPAMMFGRRFKGSEQRPSLSTMFKLRRPLASGFDMPELAASAQSSN